jgi:hypothetical protein
MPKKSNIDYYTTAVSMGDLKNGMLYFDNIIPIHLPFEFEFASVITCKNDLDDVFKKVAAEVLPQEYRRNKEFGERLFLLNALSFDALSKLAIMHFSHAIDDVIEREYEAILENFVNDYLAFVHKFDIGNYPLIYKDGGPRTASLRKNNNNQCSPLLMLSNLKIIEASDAPWEQILEFRKDQTAKVKLRKLRLFAYENYSDKSKSYIEDDILTKIYDYENIANKFGLGMVQATVNNVINSKLFAGITTGSILTTLFAEYPIGLLTVAAGAVVELGQFTLELKKQKYELQNLIKDNPASFITYYRDKYSKR